VKTIVLLHPQDFRDLMRSKLIYVLSSHYVSHAVCQLEFVSLRELRPLEFKALEYCKYFGYLKFPGMEQFQTVLLFETFLLKI